MVTVCGKQHSFLDSRMDVLVRVSRFFETENVSTPGGVEPQPSDSCKVYIWSINCAQSTAFIWYSASIGVDLFHNRIINVCIEHLITYMRIFSACVLVCACGGGGNGGGHDTSVTNIIIHKTYAQYIYIHKYIYIWELRHADQLLNINTTKDYVLYINAFYVRIPQYSSETTVYMHIYVRIP